MGVAWKILAPVGIVIVVALVSLAVLAQPRVGDGLCAPWNQVSLAVRTSPANAQVFLDGRAIGSTPLSFAAGCPGSRRHAHVSLEGYRTWEWTGLLSEPLTLDVRLLRDRR